MRKREAPKNTSSNLLPPLSVPLLAFEREARIMNYQNLSNRGGDLVETKTAAMSDATVRQMISLLKDPVPCGLRVLADERLTREEVRNACHAGGRLARAGVGHPQRAAATAVELPLLAMGKGGGWYYPTRSIVANLDDIDKRCHAGSWLDLPCVRATPRTFW